MGSRANNQVIGLLNDVSEYLIYSTYGAGCSNYNHTYEGVRRLNNLAFKIADLIDEELNRKLEAKQNE